MAKRFAGRVAGGLVPSLRREVRAGDLHSGGAHRQRLKRWLAKDDIQRLNARNADADVEKMLTNRWTDGNLGTEFYDVHAGRFERLFAGPHAIVLDWLEALTLRRKVTELIEVGCGDGRALEKVSTRDLSIGRLVGIDINAAIIERNKTAYAAQDITFLTADATAWLVQNCKSGTLLMTIGGVMEYIAPETLSRWFRTLVTVGATGVLLVEPIAPDHDLRTDANSRVFGDEDSFSHNYAALLSSAGLEVVEEQEVIEAGIRWVMILAEVPHGSVT